MPSEAGTGIDLDRYRCAVIAEMERAFDDRAPARFYRLLTYHLGQTDLEGISRGGGASAGKLLRPTLCVLACAAVGGDPDHAIPAAAAIELIHSFTLLHDDIQDRSAERRHRPTVWRVAGEAHAITAGDGMFALAQLAALGSLERGVPAERVVRVARTLNEACLRVCEGQFLDMEAEGGAALGEAAYLELIGLKTAALIAGSAEVGAALGGGDTGQVAALAEFGRLLGLAFQMQDDLLGIWGDPAVTGKPRYDDLRARKQSLPVLHAQLPRPSGSATATVGDAEIAAALAQLEAAGSRAYVEAAAERYVREALAVLGTTRLDPGPRDQLRYLAETSLGRAY